MDNPVGRVRVALEDRRTSLDDFDIEIISRVKKLNSPISFEITFYKLKLFEITIITFATLILEISTLFFFNVNKRM